MGSLQAMEMASFTRSGELSLDAGLEWHLTSNHFPPLPAAWVPAARRAIELANEDEWDTEVELPEAGRFAAQTKTAGELVEAMHLDAYVGEWTLEDFGDPDDDDDDGEDFGEEHPV